MTGYLIGSLLGRLLASYSLVLAGNFLLAKCRWRDAFKRTHTLIGIVLVLVLFVLGLVGASV